MSRIDWAQARRRLDAGWAATLEALDPGPEASRRRLEERARALARRVPTPPTGELLDVVRFRLAAEQWAVEARWVRCLLRLRDVTPLLGAPAWLMGVAELRGEVLPVADLRGLLGLDAAGTALALVLGARDAEGWLGLLVDDALGLGPVLADALRPPAARGVPRGWVRGVTGDLALLDGAALLNDPLLTVEVPS